MLARMAATPSACASAFSPVSSGCRPAEVRLGAGSQLMVRPLRGVKQLDGRVPGAGLPVFMRVVSRKARTAAICSAGPAGGRMATPANSTKLSPWGRAASSRPPPGGQVGLSAAQHQGRAAICPRSARAGLAGVGLLGRGGRPRGRQSPGRSASASRPSRVPPASGAERLPLHWGVCGPKPAEIADR